MTVRKFVRPSLPGALIPDHARGNAMLPQTGAEVTWDHNWIARQARGEIVVVEPEVPAPAKPAAPPAKPA